MLAEKPQVKKRRLVGSIKRPKSMRIKNRMINKVIPEFVNVDKFQGVILTAEDDCEVVFAHFGFLLSKGQSQLVQFAQDGDYPFQVNYLGTGSARRRASVARVGCMLVSTEGLLMTMQLKSGPTGDIRVP